MDCIRNNKNNEETLFKSPESFLFTNSLTQNSEMDSSVLDNAENLFSLNNCSDVGSKFSTPENRSLSMVKMFDRLSLDDGQFPLSSKIKEFKLVLSEANDAYIHLVTSQFLLDSYKAIKHQISLELANKIEETVTGSIAEKLSVLKSKKGERFNLLGLEKDQICIATKGTLSTIEKGLLSKQVVAVLRSTIQQISSQQKTLKGKLDIDLFVRTLNGRIEYLIGHRSIKKIHKASHK